MRLALCDRSHAALVKRQVGFDSLTELQVKRVVNNQWHRDHVRRKIARRKMEAILQLGGKCVDCGFDDLERWPIFQFDHLPQYEKTAEIGQLLRYSTERLQRELAKCELVCANCHAMRTWQRRRVTPPKVWLES